MESQDFVRTLLNSQFISNDIQISTFTYAHIITLPCQCDLFWKNTELLQMHPTSFSSSPSFVPYDALLSIVYTPLTNMNSGHLVIVPFRLFGLRPFVPLPKKCLKNCIAMVFCFNELLTEYIGYYLLRYYVVDFVLIEQAMRLGNESTILQFHFLPFPQLLLHFFITARILVFWWVDKPWILENHIIIAISSRLFSKEKRLNFTTRGTKNSCFWENIISDIITFFRFRCPEL